MISSRQNITLMIVGLFGVGIPMGAEIESHSFTQNEKQVLASGQVLFVEPEAPYLFAAAIQIDAPAQVVWKFMLDHERVPEYVTGLKKIQLLESGGDYKILEHRLKLHPLLPQFYYVFREEYGADYSIEFNRVKGSFKQLSGWWKLVPTDNEGTVILMYSTYVEIGWFIPKSWINKGIRERVPALLTTFREVIYSDLADSDTPGSTP